MKRPTITHLAEAAGVSVATVDRVLNRRLPVRDATARQVVEAADRIGFHAAGLLKQRLSEVPARSLGFLLQRRDAFYQEFGEALVKATKAATAIRGRPHLEFMDEIVPSFIAGRIREAAARCDALAIVAIDHPSVNEAVDAAAAAGKPVFTLLSDITAQGRAGYLAVDSRKAGRTAAWAISRLAKTPGKIGILLGSHRYLSQELSEISFRSYMREMAPEFQLLEPLINLDDERVAHEAVVDLLSHTHDLAGIYSAGGGTHGLVNALREEARGRRIVTVCNELTPVTREALIDGVIDLVIDTPVEPIARRTVDLMIARTEHRQAGTQQVLVPADLYISENI